MGQAEIAIRPFKPADLDKVCDIERRSFPSPWPRSSFMLFHHQNPKGFVVAIRDKEVVGYAVVGLERSLQLRKYRLRRRGHLLNLAVDQGFKRQGIGKALVESIIAYLREEGVEDVWLEVRASNLAARKLYSSLGFEETRIVKRYYPEGEDAVIMTRKLRAPLEKDRKE